MPFGQLVFRKIIVASRGQILRLKCTKFYFGWGSAPNPAGELTAGGERKEKREGMEGTEGRESGGRKCTVPPPVLELT